jgi:hypothetical protein
LQKLAEFWKKSATFAMAFANGVIGAQTFDFTF